MIRRGIGFAPVDLQVNYQEVPMKTLLAVLLLIGTPYLAKAQADDSFDLDLDPVSSEELSVDGKTAEKGPGTSLKSEARQNRSIYIVNQASSGAKAKAESESESKTEQNDTTLLNSRADELKKNRKRAEVETELKATEKIEESRLKDERRRSETLFGERFRDLEHNGETTVAPTAPVVPVAPVGVKPGLDRDELREELKYALKEKDAKKARSNTSYVLLSAGLTEFPKADNIQGNGVFGLGLGVEVNDHILVDGMFQYASYRATYPWPKSIDEYSGTGAVKFQFSKGAFRPLAGGLITYSYRAYNDDFNYNNVQTHSNALDAGVLGGAQFALTDDFFIGGEFRYLWNLTSKTGDGFYNVFVPNSQPLDEFSHYVIAITGRLNF